MPTLSVNFSDDDYRVLVRAKGLIAAETGVEPNWHDALLRFAKSFTKNAAPGFLAQSRGKQARG